MRIRRDDTAAIVVDIQERLFPHIHQHQELEKKTNLLIRGLRILQIPLIVTQQYTKGLGATIPSVAETLQYFEPIEKISFSCCGAPKFMDLLGKLEKTNIILMGTETHVCVLQTALDLLEDKYIPVIIEDCVGSRKPDDKRVAIERLWNEGVIVSTAESILFELCEEAGTEQFREISKLVK